MAKFYIWEKEYYDVCYEVEANSKEEANEKWENGDYEDVEPISRDLDYSDLTAINSEEEYINYCTNINLSVLKYLKKHNPELLTQLI